MPYRPRFSRSWLVPVPAALAAALSLGAVGAREAPTLRLGLLDDVASGWIASEVEGSRRPLARVEASWEAVEREPGVYDWAGAADAVDVRIEAGFEVVLALSGTNPLYLPDGGPPSPLVAGSVDAWRSFVRRAVERFEDQVGVFEVGVEANRAGSIDLDSRALVLKQAALAVRAESRARGKPFLVAQAAVPASSLGGVRELWARGAAAYVDILPVLIDPRVDPEVRRQDLAGLLYESLAHPPAPALWVYVEAFAGAQEAAVEALAAGASAALVGLPGDKDSASAVGTRVLGLHRVLSDEFAPAPLDRMRLDFPGQVPPEGARILGRFFRERDFSTLVVYHAPAAGEAGAPAELIVDAAMVRNAKLLDPGGDEPRRVLARSVSETGREKAVQLPSGRPLGALVFQQGAASPGFEIPTEELEVARTRGLTAEEIIARYQSVQREQENRLHRLMSRGRVDFHFQLSEGGSTIDVGIDSQYFWERGGDVEWEQQDYYINGNLVRWKNFPRLPLIQPEKVITLPLDLTLNKAYSYRLVGQGRVADREAYVLQFQPVDPDASLALYRGKVWIDKERFVRLKVSLIQGNLDPPVISNAETDHYAEYIGPDGRSYWLFSHIEGQQVWNVAGRTFVVQRELAFRDYRINPPVEELEATRKQAYASKNQMLRDTAGGFRYLVPTEDGGREVKEKIATSQLFLGFGAFKDDSQDNVVPLAAVNYFNYDIAGKDIQLNVLFAGVLGFVTVSKPDLAGGRMDGTLDAAFTALSFNDKQFLGADELLEQRLDTRPQRIDLRLGFPLGSFFKINLVGSVNHWTYELSSDAEDVIEAYNSSPEAARMLEFLVPSNHFELEGKVEARYNRRGYTLAGAASWTGRSEWEAWGLTDTATGEVGFLDPADGAFVPIAAEAPRDRYFQWDVTGFKEWFLPKFQKLRAQLSYLDGNDLDRFSRYQFSFFGDDRLNGFSGTGVRFDQGWIGRGGYAFNLLKAIQVDLSLDSARIRDRGTGGEIQSFTGIGFNGNFVGPWKTVISLGYGRALVSDVPDLEGNQEFFLLILKLF